MGSVPSFPALAAQADAVVIVDTCTFSQLDGLEDAIRAAAGKTVVIDHHQTTESIGAAQWVDASAAASGVLVAELLWKLGWPMDVTAAEMLATAITSDTGWLQFANTDGRCLRTMAALVDKGVRTDKLYMRLFQADRKVSWTMSSASCRSPTMR